MRLQFTQVFLTGKSRGLYEKAKRYDTGRMSLSGQNVSDMLLVKSGGELPPPCFREIAPEGMKWHGQSRNDVWLCLVMKAKSSVVKNNIAWETVMLGP